MSLGNKSGILCRSWILLDVACLKCKSVLYELGCSFYYVLTFNSYNLKVVEITYLNKNIKSLSAFCIYETSDPLQLRTGSRRSFLVVVFEDCITRCTRVLIAKSRHDFFRHLQQSSYFKQFT